MWGDDNLPPGYGSYLAGMEAAADAYERALETAWERLEDGAPEGVGWDVEIEDTTADGSYVFVFREGGGLEFTTTVDPYPEPDYDYGWED